ncbi:MAG: excinuclease ABC subunit UvrA [Deltaproteobacteria bacterium]|nr:excinuclease ABC subunit UvrA [Deltaproteobacteria bacterium]
MAVDKISIRGAKQHNLKNINLEIPRNRLVVITGVSGSGKSSLAFDTIFAEGQRRYVESLSAYARQFLEQMEKPDVEYIDGLSPAVSIEQKTVSRNPRSTVATVTEIYDYFRILYASIGRPHCYICGRPIASQTVQEIADRIAELPEKSRVVILAPLVEKRKGEHQKLLDHLQADGFVRVRINGEIRDLGEPIQLDKNKKHSIEAVVDRLVITDKIKNRLTDSLELALRQSGGTVIAQVDGKQELFFSEHAVCHTCGISYPDPTPAMFSFNSPLGACPECEGLGMKLEVDPDLVVPDPSLSVREGALEPYAKKNSIFFHQRMVSIANHFHFDLWTPFQDLPEQVQHALLYGSGDEKIEFELETNGSQYRYNSPLEGAVNRLKRKYLESDSSYVRQEVERFMNKRPCDLCQGARLKKESLGFRVGNLNIYELTRLTIKDCLRTLDEWELNPTEERIARRIIKELKDRLHFLVDVGLDYLTLDRSSETLSGGESQRIRLATQIGSRLSGVLYVLDEPSIGLHQRDNRKLLQSLLHMRDLGNTILVVEHDRDTILSADHVVDMGPGAGLSGGEVVFSGTPEDLQQCETSLTGNYISGRLEIPVPEKRRKQRKGFLEFVGAEHNNLKNIDVRLPLGVFTCVTGVSGSGKSSLVIETIYRHLARRINRSRESVGKIKEIKGIENIDKVVDIDQSPIGRTPRSNPATYTGVFTFIRDLFARVPESRARGYKPGRFSFNVKGGRCEACQGDGVLKIEMHFLPDVYVTCDVCKGKRYNRETLQITYKGMSIAEVLDMTVNQAAGFFEAVPNIRRKLKTLQDVGMGYVKLGQPATTLSGGEAQRIKLSKELSKRDTGRTFYILDEPTTGLHFDDIRKLLDMLKRLVEKGNTVVVIEHNMDVIKSADYIIDLGPEGGDLGGYVVASGTPEEIASVPESHTGTFLKELL